MQNFYFDASSGQCLGSFGPGTDVPPNAKLASEPPIDGRQVWNGNCWEWPVEIAREAMLGAVIKRYEAALAAGISFGGKILQIRENDHINLAAMGDEARWAKVVGQPWPTDFAWRMADDSFLPIPTADAMIALGEAAKAEIHRLQRVKWAHVDAIRALTESPDIAAYNFDKGW